MEDVNTGTLWLVVGISGTLITILLGIIGFFLSRLISDVKSVIEETGKNKGRIELVEQQQQNDVKRIEQMTQFELKVMSEKVGELASSINRLVFGKMTGDK
jgi:HAMP domain-containing protein